jgi:two-component system, chemotaxis family, sensor kinase Cph1
VGPISDSSASVPAVSVNEAELTPCDGEPIPSPGAIQPHGVLLALDPEDLRIIHAGGDTPGLAASPQSLLGENASRIFSRDR